MVQNILKKTTLSLDGIIQILVRKLEIKNKKKIFEFLLLPHGVILALKTAIMQDSGCPYTSMKSGYEIVKTNFKKIYHQI